MDKDLQIIAEIEAAFDGCFERPARVTCYKINDPEDYDGEGESVEVFYNNREWKDVRFKNEGGYLISYLEAEAMLYYLPSILISILQEKDPRTDFTDRAFGDFGNPKWFNRKMEFVKNSLSTEQKRVLVKTFIEVNSWNNWYSQEIEFISKTFKC